MVQANTAPLLEILGVGNARFVMPVYQRGYTWNREQRRELWDDILHAGQTGRPHFMGSLLLDRIPGGTATSLTRFNVVDGQQRLITLTILMDRLIRAFTRRNLTGQLDVTPGGLRRQYVYDTDAKDRMRYRLHPTEADRATLWNLIGDEPTPNRPAQRVLDAAHDFDQWMAGEDPRIIWRGIQLLEAIDAELDAGDDAQRIFESMNAKGEDLTAGDLVRNWILMHQPYDEQAEFYRNEWLPFQHTLHNDPKELDLFLRQLIVVENRANRHRGRDLYRLFKETWENAQWDAPTAMRVLRADADAWTRMFHSGETDPALHAAYTHVTGLGVIQIRPILLALHRQLRAGALSPKDMTACCLMVESYLVRRTICRIPNTTPLTVMADRLVTVVMDDTDPTPIPRRMAATLLSPGSQDRTWCPDNITFMDNLVTVPFYRLRNDLPRLLLLRLENAHHPYETVSGDLTIEHVMPQTLSVEWRDRLGAGADAVNTEWGDTIGNLTLSGANGSLANRVFEAKQSLPGKGYEASPLWLTRTLTRTDEWDADRIRERGRLLAETAVNVWPMPGAGL